jgi:hypothetical protein
MSYIYHIVPKKMSGDNLIPLSQLQELDYDVYVREIKKYEDHPKRKELPNRLIKKINCFQKEVVHFCPLHPYLIYSGLKSVFPDWNNSTLFYEIPIERIRGLSSIYFDMNRTGSYVFGQGESEEMFDLITPENYQIMNSLPQEALDFYQQWKDRGEKGAPFMGRIPHVMVKGLVSIKNCRIIDWKDKPI